MSATSARDALADRVGAWYPINPDAPDEGRDIRWPGFAWPGGYPIVYVVDDGEVLCADCMNSQAEVHFGGEADGWRVEGADTYDEGPDMACAHCGAAIASSYGDPDV